MQAPTVWLVGMMGAGKSAAGRALARRLGRPFTDTDAEVERAAGRSIPDLFAQDGEAAFRERERDVVESLAGEPRVVALGGGAAAQPGMAERLAATGVVVYLYAPPEVLLERTGDGSERPLLAGRDREGRLARLRELLREREPAYRSASIEVDTRGKSAERIADEIAERIGAQGA